jgi:DNA polymerase-3 subunit gamma/tau
VAAAGGIDDAAPSTDEIVEGLCERDVGRVLVTVAERLGAGHDPRRLAVDLLEHLRQAFLATVARGLVGLPDDEVARMESQAARMGRAAIVRAMEVLGDALVAMRDAPDTRVLLEVSLVRLCRPEADVSPAAMLERIERLERRQAAGGGRPAGAGEPAASPASAVPQHAAPSSASARPSIRPEGSGVPGGRPPTASPPPAASAPPPESLPPAASAPPADAPPPTARLALGGVRNQAGIPNRAGAPGGQPRPAAPHSGDAPPPQEPMSPPPPPPPAAAFPSRDDLTLAWGDTILPSLPPKARSRFRAGRFVDVPDPFVAGFALPTPIHRERCTEVQGDVERALAGHFGRRVPLKLLVEAEVGAAPPDPPDEEEHIDPRDLRDAPSAGVTSPVDHVMQAFEGATLVEE